MNAELLNPTLRERAMKVASRIVGPQDAEDMVQNAYLSALKTPHPFRGDSEAFTWFCRVTMNQCLMHIRDMKTVKEQTIEELPEPHSKEPTADAMIYVDQRRKVIIRAIDTLTGETKADFMAHFFNPDMTIVGVARSRRKKPNATKSNIFRARKQLAKILEDEFAA